MAILKVNTRVIYSNPLPRRAQKLPYGDAKAGRKVVQYQAISPPHPPCL